MKSRVLCSVLVLGLAAASSRTLAAGGKAEALLAGMRRDVARIEVARDALRSRAGDPASGGADARNIGLQLREFLPVYNRFGLVGYADLIVPLRTGGRLFALPAAPAATDPATPEDVYRLAQWHEAAASTVLREVRALAASVTYAVPLARAADAQWDPAGQYPHLEVGAVATGSAQGSPAAASPSVDDLLQDSVGDLGLPEFGGAPKPKAVAPAV